MVNNNSVFSDIDVPDTSGYTSRYINLQISVAEMTQHYKKSTDCNFVFKDETVATFMSRPGRFQSLALAQYAA